VIVAAKREPPDYPWEYFLECNERRYLSAGSCSQKPQRQSAIRLPSKQREERERKKISEQPLRVVPSFSSFFFSVSLFFFLRASRCLGLVHPHHFIVSVGGGRPSLIESAVLYLLGPPQPFVCFSPISVAPSLFLPLPAHLFFSFISLTKSSYQREPRNLRSSTFS
jgi:hypothetical protein